MKHLLSIATLVVSCLVGRAAEETSPLKWDTYFKTNHAPFGSISTTFNFSVVNVTTNIVEIENITTSCGCTVAALPEKPWRLRPGETNHLPILLDLRGKTGSLYKEAYIASRVAPTTLHLTAEIEAGSGTNSMSKEMMDRLWAQQTSVMDRQAVFNRRECVTCHLVPTFGKHGQQLYEVACGICHEAEHRATMVPNLRALKTEIAADYWENWVRHGKPGTLMPAFNSREGGPLDDAQIRSLVEFLGKEFPRPVKTPGEGEDD